jgi:hypothetical protein
VSTFVFFLSLYVCIFPLNSISGSFHSVYGVLIFCQVCEYGYTEEKRCALCTVQGEVVAGKSISHHHCHSAWQTTEPQWVYADTGIIEMDLAMGADEDPRAMKIDRVIGVIYS